MGQSNSLDWQNSLDLRLVHRLIRPSQQAGIIKLEMAEKIIKRCDHFLNRLPLVNKYLERWEKDKELSLEVVPIVYTQQPQQETNNKDSLERPSETIQTKMTSPLTASSSVKPPLTIINKSSAEETPSVTIRAPTETSFLTPSSLPLSITQSTNKPSVDPNEETPSVPIKQTSSSTNKLVLTELKIVKPVNIVEKKLIN